MIIVSHFTMAFWIFATEAFGRMMGHGIVNEFNTAISMLGFFSAVTFSSFGWYRDGRGGV